MAFEPYYLECKNHEHGPMEYKGEGNFECQICGFTYHDDDYDIDEDEDEESLSVYDAALIWASNGKDEDYTFGYTEEELEDAL